MKVTLHNCVSGLNVVTRSGAKAIYAIAKTNQKDAQKPKVEQNSTSPTQSDPQKPKVEQNSTFPTQSGDQKPIVEALKEKLPILPSGKGSKFTDEGFQSMKKPTGKATIQAKPPVAWKAEDTDSFLKTYFTGEAANISAPGVAPQLDKSFRLSNESDVVRASAVYLLNVVNIAGELSFPFSSKLHASSM